MKLRELVSESLRQFTPALTTGRIKLAIAVLFDWADLADLPAAPYDLCESCGCDLTTRPVLTTTVNAARSAYDNRRNELERKELHFPGHWNELEPEEAEELAVLRSKTPPDPTANRHVNMKPLQLVVVMRWEGSMGRNADKPPPEHRTRRFCVPCVRGFTEP